MPTNTVSPAKLPIMIAAWLLVAVIALIGSGLAGNAHAQASNDSIPSLTLDSHQPGQLVITWQAPASPPTDYRVSWANADLNWLSWKDANEPQRANEYPLADVTTITLSDLTPGDTYKVHMRSRYYNADRTVRESSGPWTDVITQRVMNHPPAAPTSLTASQVTHESLTLTWHNPQDSTITGYQILRGTEANSLLTIEANTGSPSASYTDSTVEPETTYHYAVQALSQDGNGARAVTSGTTPAEPDDTVQNDPPAVPTGLAASQVSHDSLTLTWDDSQDANITGYRVMRGTDAGSLSTLETDTESVSTEYEDDTVEAETTYQYAVIALSDDGDGPQSDTFSVTTLAEPTPAGTITALSVASSADGELTVSWEQPNPAPSDYQVSWAPEGENFLSYNDANEANRGNSYPDGEETSLNLTGLTSGDEYKVIMRARYSTGEYANNPWAGPWSTEATGTTAAPVVPQSISEPTDGDLSATTDTTGVVAVDQAARGTINENTNWRDRDWFAAELTAGHSYVVEVLGTPAVNCSLRGPVIDAIYDAGGTSVSGTESSAEQRTSINKITFTPTADGTHFVSVTGEANTAGTGTYVLAMTDDGDGSAEHIAVIGAQGCLPAAPTALGTSAVTHNSVTLSWTPPNGVITGYHILRATGTQPMSVIASDVASTTTQYVDDSVEPETAYSYAVVAVNDAAEGPASAIATTETDPLPVVIVNSNPGNGARSVARNGTLPATATGLTLTASFDWVTLSWDTMADASIIDYRIWRGPNASNMQVLVNNTESLSTDYIDSTVEPNTKYRYAVAAINANGVGPQSSSKITTLNLIVGRSHSVVADGSVTLVSNLGYVASSGTRQSGTSRRIDDGADQAFTTGSNTNGYTLTAVVVRLEGFQESEVRSGGQLTGWTESYAALRVNISICVDDSGMRGTCTALGHVMTRGTMTLTNSLHYIKSGLTHDLVKDTKYWILLEPQNLSNVVHDRDSVNAGTSGNNDEDEHGLAGWDILGPSPLTRTEYDHLPYEPLLDLTGIGPFRIRLDGIVK